MKSQTIVLTLCVLVFAFASVRAQGAEPDIKRYVARIDSGQADLVKRELPSLLSRYPNNPGVLYIQGLVTSEGSEAVRIYQSIVDNFPRSEWADDALYKVYQFYYALGLYRTAEIKMGQLKKEYPDSPYLKSPGRPETKNVPEEEAATVPVKPEPMVPDSALTPAKPPRETDPLKVHFVLQVGAYTTQVNAERQKQFFEKLGYSVEIISKEKENRSLFLVWVGDYPSYEAAKAEGARLKSRQNLGSIVISR